VEIAPRIAAFDAMDARRGKVKRVHENVQIRDATPAYEGNASA
jgi:hypothetical protein